MPSRLDVIALPTGEFTFPPGDPYAGLAGVVVAYAVRHSGGVFLFDTGFAQPEPELDEFYGRWQVRIRSLPDVLAEAGILPAEVTAIANCHLHVDHAGQNARFPDVPIYVQPEEWAAAHEPDYTVATVFSFPGARFALIGGDHEVAPGIRLIATPGHSPGHQSLVLGSGADPGHGPTLLAGQAVYTRGEWIGAPDAMEGASSAQDVAAYRRSVARLRSLNPRRVLFGHDRRGWPS